MTEKLSQFDMEDLREIFEVTDYFEQSAIFEIIDDENTLTEAQRDKMGTVTIIIASGEKAHDVIEALAPVKEQWASEGELEWAMPDHEGPMSIN